MQEILNRYLPNVMERLPAFGKAIGDTLIMVAWSGSIAFVLGLVLGVVLIVTRPGGILENKVLYQVLDKVINFFRSIPFIILLTWVIPLSRAIMGTAIDVPGAIVPLVLGTVPFFSRQVESALAETDKGLVEAALSMGSTITAISLVGLTAMAGAVGSGGLGDFAIRYGHDRGMTDVTWVTVIVVFILVSILQLFGNLVIKKNRH